MSQQEAADHGGHGEKKPSYACRFDQTKIVVQLTQSAVPAVFAVVKKGFTE